MKIAENRFQRLVQKNVASVLMGLTQPKKQSPDDTSRYCCRVAAWGFKKTRNFKLCKQPSSQQGTRHQEFSGPIRALHFESVNGSAQPEHSFPKNRVHTVKSMQILYILSVRHTSDGYRFLVEVEVEVKKLFIHYFYPVSVAKARAYPAMDFCSV